MYMCVYIVKQFMFHTYDSYLYIGRPKAQFKSAEGAALKAPARELVTMQSYRCVASKKAGIGHHPETTLKPRGDDQDTTGTEILPPHVLAGLSVLEEPLP